MNTIVFKIMTIAGLSLSMAAANAGYRVMISAPGVVAENPGASVWAAFSKEHGLTVPDGWNSLSADWGRVSTTCLPGAAICAGYENTPFPNKAPSGDINLASSDLVNLDGLSSIEEIGGKLDLGFSDKLENVDGLSNLRSIGGDLDFYRVRANTSGFVNLETVGGEMNMRRSSFSSPQHLASLEEVGGDLDFSYTNLYDLDGLISLARVKGNFECIECGLRDVNGLTALTDIEGDLDLRGNTRLTNLSGLSNIRVGGKIILESLWNLQELPADSLFCTVHSQWDFAGARDRDYAEKSDVCR